MEIHFHPAKPVSEKVQYPAIMKGIKCGRVLLMLTPRHGIALKDRNSTTSFVSTPKGKVVDVFSSDAGDEIEGLGYSPENFERNYKQIHGTVSIKA